MQIFCTFFGFMPFYVAPMQRPIYDGQKDTDELTLALFNCMYLVSTARLTPWDVGWRTTLMRGDTSPDGPKFHGINQFQLWNTLSTKAINMRRKIFLVISVILHHGTIDCQNMITTHVTIKARSWQALSASGYELEGEIFSVAPNRCPIFCSYLDPLY